MDKEEQKRAAAQTALQYVTEGTLIGVGTGSTANHFIDALAKSKIKLAGAVASSEATAARLKAAGIAVVDLNSVEALPVYVDGADEIDPQLQLIKGGGGALTREKIVAAVAQRFICIADRSKLVAILGEFPLPLEVIPMARAHVARHIIRLGGEPALRPGVTTDNGNVILDVRGLKITRPADLESELNHIVGVVCNGLFARRAADVALLGGPDGVQTLMPARR